MKKPVNAFDDPTGGAIPESAPSPGRLRDVELTEGHLDGETLDRLFEDLAACTEVLGVVIKAGAVERASLDARPTLDDARRVLRDGTVRGVQIRYRYEGSEWWDTLMVTPGGVRLVRRRFGEADG